MIQFSIEQLRSIIGIRVRYQGVQYQIVEILEDAPALVLQSEDAAPVIQANQFGEAHRYAPATVTIPVLTPLHNEFTADFLALEPL